jgi:glycosyltransferase involved in cell wall biosynthesis
VKILLLSAYDAASHRRWRLDLQQHLPHHQWTQLALPPRYFNWRIRGNSLSWAFSQRQLLEQDYNLLIATSMVDLSALRGFIPSLAAIPTLLYFHENQFSYPANDAQFASVEPQIISFYSALCADALVFNSEFNRTSFFAGVDALLRKLPDQVPAGLADLLRKRSQVLSVPLVQSYFESPPRKVKKFTLIWNHRWEYDKGPERLLAMLNVYFEKYDSRTTESPFTLHVVGQQFRQQPAAFAEIKTLLSEHAALGQWGFIASAENYRNLLCESHVVLSTALHDFQGLAVLEAVATGCIPLVPDRQAYPEWFGADYCYASDIENPEQEAQSMAQALHALTKDFGQGDLPKPPDIACFSWAQLSRNYDALFSYLIGSIGT